MIPSKAYILRISSDLSKEYADTAAQSCNQIGLDYEFAEGFEGITTDEAWKQTGLNLPETEKRHRFAYLSTDKAACCSASHAAIWKKLYDQKECAIILEHDAMMLHSVNVNISNGTIVTLGYKLSKPDRYDHNRAGSPKELIKINGHEGAYAYALTWETAKQLLDELEEVGPKGPIDNIYFLKMRKTKIKLSIMSPTPAIGWIRQSSIWPTASETNYEFIPSFKEHLKNVK